jgi:hypothetical protein
LKNPFLFQEEPSEGSPRKPTGFYLEPKRVIIWGQPKNPFGTHFSKISMSVGHSIMFNNSRVDLNWKVWSPMVASKVLIRPPAHKGHLLIEDCTCIV